jgi:hypothetical protein
MSNSTSCERLLYFPHDIERILQLHDNVYGREQQRADSEDGCYDPLGWPAGAGNAGRSEVRYRTRHDR